MDFPGKFSDHIMPDKLHILNVSFVVNGLVERPGGTAGNIAYALSLLGEKSIILAAIGKDYAPYFQRIEGWGISYDSIRIIDSEFTAGAYITTDMSDNQITGFNPGAMKYPSLYKFDGVNPREAIAILSAGNVEDMIVYSVAYRDRGIPFIFDPAQSLPIWDNGKLATSLEGAKILISNDYELELIMDKTKFTKVDLLKRVGAIITTKAEHGSVVITSHGETQIPAVKPDGAVVDPTGAGDAYRGGLIKGLILGKDLVESARMGAVSASYAVECQGTQEYHFTINAFDARFERHFKSLRKG